MNKLTYGLGAAALGAALFFNWPESKSYEHTQQCVQRDLYKIIQKQKRANTKGERHQIIYHLDKKNMDRYYIYRKEWITKEARNCPCKKL